MIQTGEILFLLFLLLATLYSNACFYIVRSYHRSKPLGLQTLLGQVIVVFTKVCCAVTIFCGTVVPIHVFLDLGSFFEFGSQVLTSLSSILSCAFLISAMSILQTKYLSIYHSTLLHSFDDAEVISVFQVILVGLSLSLTLIEFGYLTQIRDTVIYQVLQYGTARTDALAEKSKVGLVLTFLTTLFILQSRLEADNIRHGEGGILPRCLRNNFNFDDAAPEVDEDDYQMNVIRGVVFLLTLIMSLVLFHIIVGVGSVEVKMAVAYLTGSIATPSIASYSHQGLKNHCYQKLNDVWSNI